jgi:hypothetical protein
MDEENGDWPQGRGNSSTMAIRLLLIWAQRRWGGGQVPAGQEGTHMSDKLHACGKSEAH